MRRMSATDITTAISHRTLKNEQGRVFRDLAASGEPVAVANRGQVDGVLLPPALWEDLHGRAEAGERLRAALPLLLAAARTGVAIPSTTFEELGLPVVEDWRALNALVAELPVTLTHDPEGHPLPTQSTDVLTLQDIDVDDDRDEELELV